MTVTQMFRNRVKCWVGSCIATIVTLYLMVPKIGPDRDVFENALFVAVPILFAAASLVAFIGVRLAWHYDIVPRGLQKKALRLW